MQDTTYLLDVDKTLLNGGQINQPLIEDLITRGCSKLYLFTNMDHQDVTTKCQQGNDFITRAELVAALTEIGFEVQGVITPADVGISDQDDFKLGDAYKQYLAPLYARINNPQAEGGALTERNFRTDEQFKSLREQYDAARNAIPTEGVERSQMAANQKNNMFHLFFIANENADVVYIDDDKTCIDMAAEFDGVDAQHFDFGANQHNFKPLTDDLVRNLKTAKTSFILDSFYNDYTNQDLMKTDTTKAILDFFALYRSADIKRSSTDQEVSDVVASAFNDLYNAENDEEMVERLEQAQQDLNKLNPSSSILMIAAKTLIGALIGAVIGFVIGAMLTGGFGGLTGATLGVYSATATTITTPSLTLAGGMTGGAIGFGLGFFKDNRSDLARSADNTFKTMINAV